MEAFLSVTVGILRLTLRKELSAEHFDSVYKILLPHHDKDNCKLLLKDMQPSQYAFTAKQYILF